MRFQQFPKIIIMSVYSSLLRSKRSRWPSRLTPRTAHQIKFGEPVITGFTRSFAQRIPNGDILNGDLPNSERREHLKRMLFSGGVGQLDDRHLHKGQPEKDMVVVKVGGPAYRIALPHRYTTSPYHIVLPHRLRPSPARRGDLPRGGQ